MKKLKISLAISAVVVCAFSNAYAQTSSSAKVIGWGMHFGGQVVYRYEVQNLSQRPIKGLMIGLNQPVSGEGSAELSVLPATNGSSFWLAPSTARTPDGWGAKLFFTEESEKFAIEWTEAGYYKDTWPAAGLDQDAPIVKSPPKTIPPQATWDAFSVTLKKADFAYVNGHARVDYGNTSLTLPIEKGDGIPPDLDLRVNRTNQNGSNGRWAIFEIQATVKDNYDPSPTLVFEPITANQSLAQNSFKVDLKGNIWKIWLENVPGGIYYMRYTASDASGNITIKVVEYNVDATAKK